MGPCPSPLPTTGSPTPVLTESGALPPGLVFHANTNGTATISGTPPASTGGTYQVTITATNAVGAVAQHLAITLGTAPVITSASGPGATTPWGSPPRARPRRC